jgi:ribosomal protein S6
MPLSMENKETTIEGVSKDRVVYEVGYHIVPIVAENDLGVCVTAIRDAIEAVGGSMIADEYPRHMELSYPMVKIAANKRATHHSAYFGWMKFEVVPAGAKSLEAKLKADDTILRFILVKTARENTMVPKKVLQQKPREESKEDTKTEDKPVLTEAELDKTIEDLVIS